jgi:hypothetical protein
LKYQSREAAEVGRHAILKKFSFALLSSLPCFEYPNCRITCWIELFQNPMLVTHPKKATLHHCIFAAWN